MTKSKKRARRDVAAQLQARNRVGGANPISTLSSMSGTSPVTTKEIVSQLEEEGLARVDTHSDGRIKGITYSRPSATTDRTEKPGWKKREERFARGVPAYLPDDLCSPVTSRFVARSTSDETRNSSPFGHTNQQGDGDEVTPHEPQDTKRSTILTSCLHALRSEADSQGYVGNRSVTSVLAEKIPSMTQGQATYAYKILREMGLLFVEGVGRQRNSYIVDMDTEVTPEMLVDYRARQKEKKVEPGADSSPEEVSDSMAEQDAESSSTPSPSPAPIEASPLLQMADIIEQQEAAISELKDENAGLCDRLQELEAEITSLRSRVSTLSDELSATEAARDKHATEAQNLRQQMANQQEVDDRIASILRRHQT